MHVLAVKLSVDFGTALSVFTYPNFLPSARMRSEGIYGSWVCVSVTQSHFSNVRSSHKRYDLFKYMYILLSCYTSSWAGYISRLAMVDVHPVHILMSAVVWGRSRILTFSYSGRLCLSRLPAMLFYAEPCP